MKIQAGKKYRARNGMETVAVVERIGGDVDSILKPFVAFFLRDNKGYSININSRGLSYTMTEFDLVEEVMPPTDVDNMIDKNALRARGLSCFSMGALNDVISGKMTIEEATIHMEEIHSVFGDESISVSAPEKLTMTMKDFARMIDNQIKNDQPQYFTGEFIPGEEYEDRVGKSYIFIGYDHNRAVFRVMSNSQYYAVYRDGSFNGIAVNIPTKLDIIRHIPKPKEKVKRTVWLNILDEFSIDAFTNKADADMWDNRIACIPVEIEYYEGEGLSD